MNGAEAIAGRFELVNPHAQGSMGEVHRDGTQDCKPGQIGPPAGQAKGTFGAGNA